MMNQKSSYIRGKYVYIHSFSIRVYDGFKIREDDRFYLFWSRWNKIRMHDSMKLMKVVS